MQIPKKVREVKFAGTGEDGLQKVIQAFTIPFPSLKDLCLAVRVLLNMAICDVPMSMETREFLETLLRGSAQGSKKGEVELVRNIRERATLPHFLDRTSMVYLLPYSPAFSDARAYTPLHAVANTQLQLTAAHTSHLSEFEWHVTIVYSRPSEKLRAPVLDLICFSGMGEDDQGSFKPRGSSDVYATTYLSRVRTTHVLPVRRKHRQNGKVVGERAPHDFRHLIPM